jgi:hypothetical protein
VPAIYEHHGIRFLYPENWSLMDEEFDDWPRSVTVQSPQTAFWSLHVYPAKQELRPLVKEVVESIQASFPHQELEVLPVTDEVADTRTKGVDVTFFYLDLLVRSPHPHAQDAVGHAHLVLPGGKPRAGEYGAGPAGDHHEPAPKPGADHVGQVFNLYRFL